MLRVMGAICLFIMYNFVDIVFLCVIVPTTISVISEPKGLILMQLLCEKHFDERAKHKKWI